MTLTIEQRDAINLAQTATTQNEKNAAKIAIKEAFLDAPEHGTIVWSDGNTETF
jgi:hypothetical protein